MTRDAVEDTAGLVLAVVLLVWGGLTSWSVLACGLFIAALVIRDWRSQLRGALPSAPDSGGRNGPAGSQRQAFVAAGPSRSAAPRCVGTRGTPNVGNESSAPAQV